MPRAAAADFDFDNSWKSPCIPAVGREPDPAFADACKRMSGPQYFHGVWSVEFEMSNFTFPGRLDCHRARDRSCIAIAGEALPWPGRWACSREYEVEFIGRRSLLPGPYLHGGVPGYRIAVDRLISAKRLPDPPDPNCDPAVQSE